MINHEISLILFEIGEMLENEGVPFKPQTYQQAAIALDNLDADIKQIYDQGGLKALMVIPAIGDSMAARIEEYILTGQVSLHQELKSKTDII